MCTVSSCFAIMDQSYLGMFAQTLLQSFYTFLDISSVMDPCFCLEGIKCTVNIS